jgi:hypothetical protein
MKLYKSWMVLLAVVLAISIAWIFMTNVVYPGDYRWNQEFILTFDYNDVNVISSAAQSVVWTENSHLGSVNGPSWLSQIKGSMPYLILEDGRILVALLTKETDREYATKLLYDMHMKDSSFSEEEDRLYYISMQTKSVSVPEDRFPQFALFGDSKDPTNFTIIDAENLDIEVRGLSLIQVDLKLLPYESIEQTDILDVLPYLKDPKYDTGLTYSNFNENPYPLPTWIYRE